MRQQPLTRRQLLTSLAGAAGIGAGCNGQTREDSTPSPQTGGAGLPSVRDVEVTDSELVVTLTADHDVSTLSLIGPDGQAVVEQSVATGAETVPLPILSIEPDLGSYEHYTPGEHELVVDTGDETHRTTVPLEPDLQITTVEQYTDGDSPAQLGNLAITVENTGTGPTWVYDITYRDSPNFAANGELTGEPGTLLIKEPITPDDLTLHPGEAQVYVGSPPPLNYPSDGESNCENITESFIVEVGSAAGHQLEETVKATANGARRDITSSDQFTCVSFEVEIQGEES